MRNTNLWLAGFRILLYAAATFYLVLVAVAVFLADRMIFQPQSSSYRDTPDLLKLTTSDGTRITAIYLPNPNATYTLLFSHGNAEDIGDNFSFFIQLRAAGFAVFSYDYHGYGTSEGTPSEKAIYADIDAAYEYLTGTLKVPPDRIISFGRSVGASAAIDLAARKPLGGLIVQSGFTTAFRVLTHVALVPFDKFHNLDKIRNVRCPILFMHGRNDEVIPFRHGLKLYERANAPKTSLWVEGAHHNDFELVAGKRYFAALKEFAATLEAKNGAIRH
ncbi:MAG: alpha/beta hydrolase [Acidobacteriales bacterium]|nr:alpha/beta hydrolase [Terriglobales bacterium]